MSLGGGGGVGRKKQPSSRRPCLRRGGGGARALDGTRIRAASEHEPVVVLVCVCVCVRVPTCVLYEADTCITYSSVLSAGLPHCVFQHASQSLCRMHYLTLTLTRMQIAAEIFILDILANRLERFSNRLWQSNVQVSRPLAFILHFTTSGHGETPWKSNYERSGLKRASKFQSNGSRKWKMMRHICSTIPNEWKQFQSWKAASKGIKYWKCYLSLWLFWFCDKHYAPESTNWITITKQMS